jgi:hypothetical protein
VAPAQQSTLVVLTTGKAAFVRANSILLMALVVRATVGARVELLLRRYVWRRASKS